MLLGQQKLAEQASQHGFDIDTAGREAGFKTDTLALGDLAKRANQAQTISPQLQQLGTVMQGAVQPGFISSLITNHPDITPYLVGAGAVTPEQATNTQLTQGITKYLSVLLRPEGSGRQNVPEIEAFKTVLPTLMEDADGRAKAQAFLQNQTDRVPEELNFKQKYFNRIDPTTGKPAYNLTDADVAMSQPRKVDPQTGINSGGLGPIVPPMPPQSSFLPPKPPGTPLTSDDLNTVRTNTQNWINNNVEPGRPYMGWDYPKDPKTKLPDKTKGLTLQLMVRGQ